MIDWNSLDCINKRTRFIDASDLGLSPGHFPETLTFRDGRDGHLTFSIGTVSTFDGDVQFVYYECRPAGLFLKVHND